MKRSGFESVRAVFDLDQQQAAIRLLELCPKGQFFMGYTRRTRTRTATPSIAVAILGVVALCTLTLLRWSIQSFSTPADLQAPMESNRARSSKLAFVTAFIDLGPEQTEKSMNARLGHFRTLASAGIHLIVFVSPSYLGFMNELQVAFPNVLHIQCIEMQELMTVQTIRSAPSLQLPRTLTSHKDTHGFLELMLSKIDLVHRALNYTDASHLAWIDFNIAHVFSGDKPLYALFALQHRRHLRLDGLLMPRIWERGTNMDGDSLRNKVNWRFAGGFFLGDRASLGRWYELQSDSLRLFLEETHTLVWEVNFWAWMEQTYPHSFHPHVYISDHDNSLVQVPPDWDEE